MVSPYTRDLVLLWFACVACVFSRIGSSCVIGRRFGSFVALVSLLHRIGSCVACLSPVSLVLVSLVSVSLVSSDLRLRWRIAARRIAA